MYFPTNKTPEFFEQRNEIIQGLKSGKRLAYDQAQQKLVALPQKSGDSRYIQDLEILTNKVMTFLEDAKAKGLTSQEAQLIENQALERSVQLISKMSGFLSVFLSQKEKETILQQTSLLQKLAYRVHLVIEGYLDANKLVRGSFTDQPIESRHREWFLNQAIYLPYAEKCDEKTKQQLYLAALHGYSKAATILESDSKRLGIQASPFLVQDYRYHRSTDNAIIDHVNKAYSKDMNLFDTVQLISSPLIEEVFSRENPLPEVSLKVHSVADFENIVDHLLTLAQSGSFPKKLLLVNLSPLMHQLGYAPEHLSQLLSELHTQVKKKLDDFALQNPSINPDVIEQEVLSKLQPYFITQHKEQDLLLTPQFSNYFSKEDEEAIITTLTNSGFRLSPDEIKAAWLKVSLPQDIFKQLGIPLVQLATQGTYIPTVCKDYATFLQAPVVKKFKELSLSENPSPYLKILPEATFALLEGLDKFQPDIGTTFQKNGISDVLQIAYFRLLNAMGEAILRKEDQIAFLNQIELIHQEIQTILILIEPYSTDELQKTVAGNLSSLIPSDMDQPKIHLKHSAMHTISSVFSSIESQKNDSHLHLALLKNSYYESTQLVYASSTYTYSTLNGERFDQTQDVEKAFSIAPKKALDALVCEFHHNISFDRYAYYPENITEQVLSLFEKKMVADQFTVIIDTTINLEQSNDLRLFLHHPKIQNYIQEGRLNVVLVRSTQKFDMLGIDNYYGGMSVTINNQKAFTSFNQRMDHPDDQLEGLSYQGITHLQKYCHAHIEAYRQAIMDNTQRLYASLPQQAIYTETSTNPMQISKKEDDKLVFIDIKFPRHQSAAKAFTTSFLKYCAQKKLPTSSRSSFGFATTNLIAIESGPSLMIRISPGLENAKTLQMYADFIHLVQQTIAETLDQTVGRSRAEVEMILADRIDTLF